MFCLHIGYVNNMATEMTFKEDLYGMHTFRFQGMLLVPSFSEYRNDFDGNL